MRSLRVVIVGGGIGGMAFAAALQRLGGNPVVLERAPKIEEVGSGLGVLPGAVRALRGGHHVALADRRAAERGLR